MRNGRYAIIIAVILTIVLGVLLSACSEEPESAEAQIRAVIGQAADAAQNKELGELKDLIADDYQDDQGYDKKNISRLLALYFFRNQSIYLSTRIDSITLDSADNARQANVVLLVAMAGTPLPDDLRGFSADLMRFDIIMVNQGGADWQLQSAAWRRADIQDFL